MMTLETKRLKIIPLNLDLFGLLLDNIEKMEEQLNLIPSGIPLGEHVQKAMEYSYNEALKRPDDYIWFTNWQIVLKNGNVSIGSAGFKNIPDESGSVEIGYGINDEYRNCGYMTEALAELSRWALQQERVNFVVAETFPENYASQKVLQKCGFVNYQKKDDNLWWKKGINIRPETEKDYDEIYDLIKTAFETADVKDGDEQDFAVGLRNSINYIPELALIAETDGKLTGHIMLTKTYVQKPDGNMYEALLLAPISVLLEYRDRKIGSALIYEGFRLAREMGFEAVFLCGDPAYYHRFGFRPTASFGISNRQGYPEENVMVCELKPNALKGVAGVADFC